MKYIDDFLNGITMYKLVLFGLFILALISIILGLFHVIFYSWTELFLSLLLLFIVTHFSNELFSKIFKVTVSPESAPITALILFFLITPAQSLPDFLTLALAGFIAMASKYLLAIRKKHIFNPSAFSVFVISLLGFGVVSWWVGSFVLFLPTFILSLLVARKLRRMRMFILFLIVSFLSIVISRISTTDNVIYLMKDVVFSWPLIFLGGIMLTEPLTTPPSRRYEMVYAVIVGVLTSVRFEFYGIYSTPELALLLGNIFSYIVSPKYRLVLTLLRKEKITEDVYNFIFKSDRKFSWKPGQYLEWTLGHQNIDMRGNRRYFTIASSPTEENIILGTKFYKNPSSYKQKLMNLNQGDTITASQLSGDFTLNEKNDVKYVFIAGGIGVTPFRSMAKYLIDNKQKMDVVFFYSNKSVSDIAYREIFDEANKQVGWKNIYLVNSTDQQNTENLRTGILTSDVIKEEVSDFKERIFYISGPHLMVASFEEVLVKMGVKKNKIVIDYFPGFA